MSAENREMDEIRELTTLSEDELYRRLATEGLARQALPLDPRDLADRGRRMFQIQSVNLRGAICGSVQLRSFVSGNNDLAEIAIEILKIISTVVVKVSPVTLCVLLAKIGIKNLCQSEWSKDDT